MKKLFIALSVFMVSCGQVFAGTVSFDQLAVSSDLTAVKYNSDLNRIYQKVNSAIQADNIENDSISEVDMADDANPRIRTSEGASCEKVVSGLLPPTSASLTTSTSAGTAYPEGYRIVKSSATPHTYTASKWTWVDLDQNGDFQYSEVAIGGVTPAIAANSIRLARVSTDGTTVNTVTDLRTTSCTSGPFDIITDASGESSLADIFENGGSGWLNGLNITSKDSTSVYIQPGAAYINGEYRSLSTALTVNGSITAAPTSGTSGIDSGSLAASTTYYVYGVADLDSTKPLTGVLSTSASTPTGATNYRRLGDVTTDASASFVSSDATSVSSLGKIVQIKRYQTGAMATGTTQLAADDSIPTSSEGDQYMSLAITPINSANKLKIDISFFAATSAGTKVSCALFQDSVANALAAWAGWPLGANDFITGSFSYVKNANSVAKQTYKVRLGPENSETLTFNGANAGRLFGGVLSSSITITEYQP